MRKYQVIFIPVALAVLLGIAFLSGTIAGHSAGALRSDASLSALPSLSGMQLSGARLLPPFMAVLSDNPRRLAWH